MCQREGISLRLRGDFFTFETVVDDDISFVCQSPIGFRNFFKDKNNKESFNYWEKLESQGRYIRETKDIDNKLSLYILKNHKVNDKFRNFILKCRLQLLPCQSLLSLYYPHIHNKKCEMCNFPYDTVSHVLNGCLRFKLMYQDRHNRIVDILFDKITYKNKTCKVLKDKVLKPNLFNSALESFNHHNTRPDIVVVDEENKSVILNEVCTPYDCHMTVCYEEKFNKYFPLCLEINEMGYHAEVVVLLIGSMGSVHKRFVSGLRKNNISRPEAYHLARYCSVSSCIGSFKVWKRRCSYLDN